MGKLPRIYPPDHPNHPFPADTHIVARVPSELKMRLALASELSGDTHSDIIRRGVQAEIDRLLSPAGLELITFPTGKRERVFDANY